MKKLFYKIIDNIENYKIYHIIIFFTVAFVMIFFNGFYHIREELTTIASQNRLLTTKEIEYTISNWVEERVNHIENSMKFLANQNDLKNEKDLESFIATFLQNNLFFETVQLLLDDSYFYVNQKIVHDYSKNPFFIGQNTKIEPLQTKWYLKTKNSMKTTITVMEKHGVLLEKTMNICTPIVLEKTFKGVLCGVIKVNSMFEKINKLDFPQKSYYFIMSSEGSILTEIPNLALKKEIEKSLMQSPNNIKSQKLLMDNDVITLTKLKDFDWFVGVGMNKKDIMHESSGKVTSHGITLFLAFLLLVIISNFAHTFLRKRIEKKKKEYEYMLAHRSRISEIGNLISGINHQLKQPLNAVTLVVSTTLDMSERNLLEKPMLEDNLKLCLKSISLMDKTIGLFRNFYRCSQAITRFKLLDCVQSVLHVTHVELSHHNIIVEINTQDIEYLEIESIENYIQQILLVLIQNAKDAFTIASDGSFKKKMAQKILLNISSKSGKVTIDIADWGCGISKETQSSLFSEFKSSKKYEGSGIGLYFAKKLAKEKLCGDLILHNAVSPTIFRLTFAQYLHNKESKCIKQP